VLPDNIRRDSRNGDRLISCQLRHAQAASSSISVWLRDLLPEQRNRRLS